MYIFVSQLSQLSVDFKGQEELMRLDVTGPNSTYRCEKYFYN